MASMPPPPSPPTPPTPPTPPPPSGDAPNPFSTPAVEFCYRHPKVATGVHCTRCGKAICPDCMTPAPVGYQCPDCVAEAKAAFKKGTGAQTLASTGQQAIVTKVLLGIMIVVFIVELVTGGPGAFMNGPANIDRLGAEIPIRVAQGEYWRFLTAMFLHFGIFHLALNAYALWIFGQFVERVFGRVRFLTLYLLTGFLAGVASYAFAPLTIAGLLTPSAGASGAIFGLFGVFFAYNYRRRQFQYNRAMLQQAYIIIALNVAINIFGHAYLDWKAHLGGAFAGILAGYLLEGFGEKSPSKAAQAVILVGLFAAGVAVVAWKTGVILNAVPGIAAAGT
jgi:membrane associated rhomboid family serine protease